jgi:hypothetical protein
LQAEKAASRGHSQLATAWHHSVVPSGQQLFAAVAMLAHFAAALGGRAERFLGGLNAHRSNLS